MLLEKSSSGQNIGNQITLKSLGGVFDISKESDIVR